MKKDGFTLVELLATIVIIGVVSIIAIPSVINSIQKAKQKAYDTQMSEIIAAAKKWSSNNTDKLDEYHLNNTYITLTVLKQEEYLDKGDLKDPRDNQTMSGCIEITYNYATNSYDYNYSEESVNEENACDGKEGYIYTYNNADLVEDKSSSKEIAHNTIYNNESTKGIKVIGETEAGLYDINDEYVFRGSTVSNYIKLGNELWRIISMNKKDKTIKLIKNTSVATNVWDSNSNIKFENSTVKTEQLDPLFESSTSILSKINNKIDNKSLFNVGIIDGLDNYDVLKSKEAVETINYKIGLINISDYMVASTTCDILDATLCSQNNYLFDMINGSMWTMSSNGIDKIWYVKYDSDNNSSSIEMSEPSGLYAIYPVIVLNTNITITSGDGSKDLPYIIETLEV